MQSFRQCLKSSIAIFDTFWLQLQVRDLVGEALVVGDVAGELGAAVVVEVLQEVQETTAHVQDQFRSGRDFCEPVNWLFLSSFIGICSKARVSHA